MHNKRKFLGFTTPIQARGDRLKISAIPKSPKVGDLFSGAGLFGHAFASEGAELRFAVELDTAAAASYARNIGHHVHVGKVEAMSAPGRVDVLVAGPPCQGFSTLGRRDPKDVRNKLCLEIPRWASESSASVVVVENVPPFLRSPQWRTMARKFRAAGFDVITWELNAADFGVPQQRTRSFTIASSIGIPKRPEPLAGVGCDVVFRDVNSEDPMHVWPEATELQRARMRYLPRKGDWRDIYRQAPELCPPSWARLGAQATDVWGRIDPRRPSNTLRCDFQNPSKGRYLHPTKNRPISLREGARLQQVPDSWVFEGSRTAIARQIGNAVPLGLGRAVARQVIALFEA